jgi:hypothetical protein
MKKKTILARAHAVRLSLRRSIKAAALICVCSNLAGCVMYLHGDLEQQSIIQSEVRGNSALHYDLKTDGPYGMTRWAMTSGELCRIFEDELDESRFFGRVRESNTSGDLNISVRVSLRNDSIETGKRIISGLFWAAFPMPIWHHATISYDVRVDEKIIASYTYREGATVIIWLPLVVAYPFSPFYSPGGMVEHLFEQSTHHLIKDMKSDGMLPVKSKAIPNRNAPH